MLAAVTFMRFKTILSANVQWETCYSDGFFWLELPPDLYFGTSRQRFHNRPSEFAAHRRGRVHMTSTGGGNRKVDVVREVS